MSLDTWKAEFYPVSASSDAAMDKPITHSLRKWEGLRADAMRAHEVWVGPTNRVIVDFDDNRLGINGISCALCVKYFDDLKGFEGQCRACPLYSVRGKGCDRPTNGSPYVSWITGRDPEPMIELLEAALAKFPEDAP